MVKMFSLLPPSYRMMKLQRNNFWSYSAFDGVTNEANRNLAYFCASCPGAVDWHNDGSVLGVWEFGWDWFMYSYLLLYTILWTIGGPSIVVCNGPTSWQCSQAYMFDPVRVHVVISFCGLLRLSFLPKVLGGAAPFGGGTTHAEM